jgi:membrane fusion protein, heavy metal efflux system
MSASTFTVSTGLAVVAAVALVAAGGAGTWLAMRNNSPESKSTNATAPRPSPLPSPSAPISNSPLADVAVPLSEESIKRAGIVVAPVTTGTSSGELRLPGIVEPNAYRQVDVTPVAAGRVTSVPVALGASVRRGQALAQIYSPELAEAQTKYVSARAMLEAHDRELQRTEKLVSIGAASRQELERIHAEHAAQSAEVQSARAQLELLGVTDAPLDNPSSKLTATINVPAPIAGIITARLANPGLNVDTSTKLFTVVDLSSVWVVADIFEKDFSYVRVGSDATVTTSAYPQMALRGRVSYIDPQVNVETRTAKVRVEVGNPRAELRLGMFADVVVRSGEGDRVPAIPRSSVQNIGDRTVVYVADDSKPGTFIEREVHLGSASGGSIAVESGLKIGDAIVSEGSFFVRAERDRLGLRTSAVVESPGQKTQEVKIVVNEKGFEPARVALRAGIPARLTFVRTTDQTCATEVVFASLYVRKQLPLNQAATIEFTPDKRGEIGFSCGINMFKGTIAVQP